MSNQHRNSRVDFASTFDFLLSAKGLTAVAASSQLVEKIKWQSTQWSTNARNLAHRQHSARAAH
jgi:hypothetical protein